jgi:hypothetical protein
MPPTRPKAGQTVISLRKAGSTFLCSLLEAAATTPKTRETPSKTGANISAYFSDLYGIELGQIDSGAIEKINRARLGMSAEELPHFVHYRLVTRSPNVWDVG